MSGRIEKENVEICGIINKKALERHESKLMTLLVMIEEIQEESTTQEQLMNRLSRVSGRVEALYNDWQEKLKRIPYLKCVMNISMSELP